MNQLLKTLLKKIFVKDRPSTNKTINNIFSFLHTIWLPSSIVFATLDTIGTIDSLTSVSIVSIHLILIIRNVNPLMFQKKEKISNFTNGIFRFTILLFIFNVFVFTWSFAFAILLLSLIGRLLYIELPKSQEKMKEQNEFKQQFNDFDGDINDTTITKKHIENLFEKDIALENIDQKSLKKQFRDLAKIYHPDKNNGEHNDRFHSIKQSYDYLKEKI